MPSRTAAWSKLSGAIGRVLHWLLSKRRMRLTPPLLGGPEARLTRSLQARVNGRPCTVPILADAVGRCEAIAAAAELSSRRGGLDASLISTDMVAARVGLSGCAAGAQAPARITAVAGQLLQMGMEASPQRWMPLGCIPALEVQDHEDGKLGVMLYSECCDAMGRSVIEIAAQAMATPLAALAECTCAPAIELGLVRMMRAKVRSRVSVEDLMSAATSGARLGAPERALGDEVLAWFGVDRHEPELAAAHNGVILEGMSAAANAMGLEAWRFVAAARRHAARWGSCEPLARWRRQGHELSGQLEVPVDLESACLAMPFAGDAGARREVARRRVQWVAAVGLLASLAYLRAVVAIRLGQGAADGGKAARAVSFSASQRSRDSGIAESGVRLIATDQAGSQREVG